MASLIGSTIYELLSMSSLPTLISVPADKTFFAERETEDADDPEDGGAWLLTAMEESRMANAAIVQSPRRGRRRSSHHGHCSY